MQSTTDSGMTNCLISLICGCKSPSSAKKIDGRFAALRICREAMIVVMGESAACARDKAYLLLFGNFLKNLVIRGVQEQLGLRADGDRVDIRVCEKIGADDTLIISVILKDYTLDHMFTKRGFHCNDYWAMSVDNGTIGHFDFTTYPKLERLFVESAFD
uniref:Uncharacterized protein n=1 Tax=Romanomermis culicivorax TaxID=13658 RepID=A0A915HTK2_ROMCU